MLAVPLIGCHHGEKPLGEVTDVVKNVRGPMVTSPSLRWLVAGGLAGVVGGLCWAMKAAIILATGVQPKYIYEVAQLFFPVVVIGLCGLINDRPSRLGRAALAVAFAAELAANVAVLGLFFGPEEWTPADDKVTVLTPFITMAGLGALLGVALVGLGLRRTSSLRGGLSVLSMVLGLTALPLIALGAVLESINERLFELPTLLIGVEWAALGAAMLRFRRRADPGSVAAA